MIWIFHYQGVPQGTILGPFRFNLYIDSLHNVVQHAHIIDYPDDNLIFSVDKNYLKSFSKMSQNIVQLLHFSEMHHLTVYVNKMNLSFFLQKIEECAAQVEIIINGDKITSSNLVKCLGVTQDRNLTYQEGVQIILREMAVSVEAMHKIRSIYGEQTMLLLLKSIILSHLLYLSPLLPGITSNFIDTLNQQVNWALKICFYCKSYDSSYDLRERYQTLLISAILDIKAACYFRK